MPLLSVRATIRVLGVMLAALLPCTACGTTDNAAVSVLLADAAVTDGGSTCISSPVDASASKIPSSLLGVRYLNVQSAPYSAAGDGTTDDTVAIQRALDDAGHFTMPSAGHYTRPTDPGHGGLVFVPAGRYLVAGSLTVPPFVTLIGEFAGAPSTAKAWSLATSSGTVLLSTAGAGKPDAPPFISLSSDATLEGISIFYPNQTDTNPPIAYPWSIRGLGLQVSVLDVTLVNAFRGIDLGTEFIARYYVRGLYGQPLDDGMVIDHSLDIGRVQNVQFAPIWHSEPTSPAYAYARAKGTGITVLRSDWGIIQNADIRGYFSGIAFGASPMPCTIAGSCGNSNGQLTHITIETDVGLDISAISRFGVHVTDFNFTALAGGKNRIAIWEHPGATAGYLTVSHGTLSGPMEQAALWESPGGLTFSDIKIGAWNAAKPSLDLRMGQLIAQRVTFAPGKGVALSAASGAQGTATNNVLGGNIVKGTVTVAGNTP